MAGPGLLLFGKYLLPCEKVFQNEKGEFLFMLGFPRSRHVTKVMFGSKHKSLFGSGIIIVGRWVHETSAACCMLRAFCQTLENDTCITSTGVGTCD